MMVVHLCEKLGLRYCMSQLGTWVGGWVGGCQTPPPPPGGVGHLSVCGYAKILGGWVPELTPPPLGSVGPNFSHHKARVQAVGWWFPLGTRKHGSRPFAAPTPTQQKWGRTESRPSTPPPEHALAPSLQAVTW